MFIWFAAAVGIFVATGLYGAFLLRGVKLSSPEKYNDIFMEIWRKMNFIPLIIALSLAGYGTCCLPIEDAVGIQFAGLAIAFGGTLAFMNTLDIAMIAKFRRVMFPSRPDEWKRSRNLARRQFRYVIPNCIVYILGVFAFVLLHH